MGDRSDEDWVDVGRIGKTVGLRGEVALHVLLDEPRIFAPGEQLYLASPGGRRTLRVASLRKTAKRYVVRFEGCERVEDVASWVGSLLQLPSGDLPALEEDQYYYHDLIGLKVFAADGRFLGVVTEILTTGGNDVYAVRHEGREILVPAIKDAIGAIDLTAGEMHLKDLEGLIEP